jgi:hypothetical protein
MQSFYYDGLIYFKGKIRYKTNKGRSNFYDNFMLLQKQSLGVCRPRVLDESSGIPWAHPSLWFSPLLDISWCGVPLFPMKRLQHKTFSHLFSRGDISGTKISCLLPYYTKTKLFLYEPEST